MKIRSSEPVTGYSHDLGEKNRRKEEQGQGDHRSQDDKGDAFVLMGIPESELTLNVRAAIKHLLDDIRTLQGKLETAEKQIHELTLLADRDTLTPVMNRRAFLRELERLLAQARRHKQPVCVLFFDIDDMKQVNDTYSHAAGDKVLLALAHRLVETARASDFVGRLGGDEFGVALPLTTYEQGEETAERLKQAVSSAYGPIDGQTISVSITYGLYLAGPDDDSTTALARADAQMYRNKKPAATDLTDLASGDDIGQ